MTKPFDFLCSALAAFEPHLQADGELFDPVIGEPFQYGTAYFARAQATAALFTTGMQRTHHLGLAMRAFGAALRHVEDVGSQATASHFDSVTGKLGHLNHRDFFWPPLLNSYRIFKQLAQAEVRADAQRLREVDVPRPFRSMPPSNWAMVWLSGEWKRMREGLSPTSKEQFDDWLAVFFESDLIVERGLYLEPGYPNSYDLFTRVHLADILLDGYDGRWLVELERLMVTGLQRSLAVQLSDGSLASAHRSTGQTWTVGAQIAFFTLVANWFRNTDDTFCQKAEVGARRAYASLVRWQRPDGSFSPVENVLPPQLRIGYEHYTADASYGNLSLGFLANAIQAGFNALPWTEDERAPQTLVENDPFHRALVHAGPYSLQLDASPSEKYDGLGITDVSFGVGRRLQFVTSAYNATQPGEFFNIGIARRSGADAGEVEPLAQRRGMHVESLAVGEGPASLRLRAQGEGEAWLYEIYAALDHEGVHITERTIGEEGYRTLLIPYLRDDGSGIITEVTAGQTSRFQKGSEQVIVEVENPIERVIDQPTGYQNRRGLCGLLRLDFREPTDMVCYHIRCDTAH